MDRRLEGLCPKIWLDGPYAFALTRNPQLSIYLDYSSLLYRDCHSFLDPQDGSQIATLVVILVIVVISSP